MSRSPATPSFARTPGLSRMRSQRIVHVVQTEDNKDVSVVTMSEDGRSQKTRETVDFSAPRTKNRDDLATLVDSNEESDRESIGDPIIFEVDLDDGDLQRLTRCVCEDHKSCAQCSRTSLFSDDEFEPIRMTLPKRPKRPPPPPLRFPSHMAYSPEGRTFVSPAHTSPLSPIASGSSSHSRPRISPAHSLANTPTQYAHSRTPQDSSSSDTLVSTGSTSSVTTYFDRGNSPKSAGRTFCAYEKDGDSPKPVDVVTPDNVTGTRGLVDLRVYGYGFDWSRFAGRTDAVHGLSPEEAAEIEVYLKRGPNAFPSPTKPKSSPIKAAFEKKLSGIFKRLK